MRHSGRGQPLSSLRTGRVGRRAAFERLYTGPATIPGAGIPPGGYAGAKHWTGILRAVLPPDRLPDYSVNLPATHPGRADGASGPGLADLPGAATRARSRAVHSG